MKQSVKKSRWILLLIPVSAFIVTLATAFAQDTGKKTSSYMPVDITEDFAAIMARMKAAKPAVEKKHIDLLNERYDLSNRPAKGVAMSRGKPIQEGVRVKLPKGMTWEKLAAMTPEEIKKALEWKSSGPVADYFSDSIYERRVKTSS